MDYMAWGSNSCTNCYSVFFLSKYGNWHTGNSKPRRVTISPSDDEEDHAEDNVKLEHMPHHGLWNPDICSTISFTATS